MCMGCCLIQGYALLAIHSACIQYLFEASANGRELKALQWSGQPAIALNEGIANPTYPEFLANSLVFH